MRRRRGASSAAGEGGGRPISLAWLVRNWEIVYIGNLVRALSVSLVPPASPVIEVCHRDARDDRLSSELHMAMEGVKLQPGPGVGHLLSDLPPDGGPSPDDFADPRRVHGLHAILRLHFAHEEEAYAWLASEADRPERATLAS